MTDGSFVIKRLPDVKKYASEIGKIASQGNFGLVDDVLRRGPEETGREFTPEEVLRLKIIAREKFLETTEPRDLTDFFDGSVSVNEFRQDLQNMKDQREKLLKPKK